MSPVRQPQRLPRTVLHAHARGACCARHTGSGTGLPHGVERRYHPARVWQALSAEPVGELQASALIRPGTVTGGSSRSGITAEGVPSAILTAQACSSAAVAPAAVFQIPSVAAAANCRAPATTPGAGVAAGPPGRGLCAWIHAPARTPAVMTGCHTPRPHDSKFTIDSKHQCKLPRQLSAEILARAFAPRRATSGLVRIPPASGASGGESRSLGKRITP